MWTRTRTKNTKVLKENNVKLKSEPSRKGSKPIKKPLVDKTNSPDDNTAVEHLNKSSKINKVSVVENLLRPRRERRLPTRFVNNHALNNLSNSKDPELNISDKIDAQSNQISDIKKQRNVQQNKTRSRNTKITSKVQEASSNDTPLTINKSTYSPFKGSSNIKDNIMCGRPKRIHRLPAHFSDHSMSPTKFVPILPTSTSTPLQQKATKRKVKESKKNINNITTNESSPDTNNNPKNIRRACQKVDFKKFFSSPNVSSKSKSPVFKPSKAKKVKNNQSIKILEGKQDKEKNGVDVYEFTYDPEEEPPPQKKKKRRVIKRKAPMPKFVMFQNNYEHNLSKTLADLKKLISKKTTNISNKQTAKSHGGIANDLTAKNNQYDKNINTEKIVCESDDLTARPKGNKNIANKETIIDKTNHATHTSPKTNDNENTKKILPGTHFSSIRIEDIVADFELSDDHNDINYSPVNSPLRCITPNPDKELIKVAKSDYEVKMRKHTNTKKGNEVAQTDKKNSNMMTETDNVTNILPKINSKNTLPGINFSSIRIEDIAADFDSSNNNDVINYSPVNFPQNYVKENTNLPSDHPIKTLTNAINSNDPLNLQTNLSFFEKQPVASSSMNTSVRHPMASPWRVEFENLPIKWQINTYVKPNMTPAVDCSFISSKDENKRKHVYTNMVPQSNETLPEVVNDDLKQTSIISFIKEVAERSASKKKRAQSVTPVKAYTLFQDTVNHVSKSKTISQKISTKDPNEEISHKKQSSNKENVIESRKRRNENDVTDLPAKSVCREKDKDKTYFGFDNTENEDAANIPNKKISNRIRELRHRGRAVLQEINAQDGPMRANIPIAAKAKAISSTEAVRKMYEQVKSAEIAPNFDNTNNILKTKDVTNVNPQSHENDDADSNSVHLFEDIELIHYLKQARKSYGKPKKVAFRHQSSSNDETPESDVQNESDLSEPDDLGDLTFTMPAISDSKKRPVRKKKKTKTQMSSKEKKEADKWAAGFNSMCDDIEEFQLVLE